MLKMPTQKGEHSCQCCPSKEKRELSWLNFVIDEERSVVDSESDSESDSDVEDKQKNKQADDVVLEAKKRNIDIDLTQAVGKPEVK